VPLTADDYKSLYEMLTSSETSRRQQGQQLASKLRPDEAQQFFEFQHAVNRPDVNASPDRDIANVAGIGISPEMALGAGQAGRAVAGAVRGTGAVAGAVEAATQLAPTVKYELAKTALTSMGVPTPLAVLAAQAISLYRVGGATKTAAAESTSRTPPVSTPVQSAPPVEPPPAATVAQQSAPPPPPASGPRPVARSVQEAQTSAPASRGPVPVQMPATRSPMAAESAIALAARRAKVPVTKAEMEMLVPPVVSGVAPETALAELVKRRAAPDAAASLARITGSMSDADVAAEIAARVGNRSPTR
jgi:hypothetical protein